jgi:hypothetical protein
MLMVVVAVVGMCIYFMMSRESATGDTNLRAGHSVAGASGQKNAVVPPGISTTYTGGNVKSVANTNKIISFDPQTGDIDDTITLGDITQNAYYLAEQGRLDMMEKSNAAATARGQLNTKINNLANAIQSINYALTGSTLGNPMLPLSSANNAKLIGARGATPKIVRADTDYKIIISGDQRSVGEDLNTVYNEGYNYGVKSVPVNSGKQGGVNSGAAFKFKLAPKDAQGKVI